MKASLALALLVLIAGMGCRRTEDVADTDTANTATTSPEMAATVPSADTSATTTGVTGGTVTYMSNDDKTFVVKASLDGLAEIGLSTTASTKATAPDVKSFASRMLADHTKISEELKSLAITKGLGLATSADEKHKEIGDRLARLSGREFDREYMIVMAQDHEVAVADFDKASREAEDADIKRWATAKLPLLRDHLKMAKDIQRSMK